MGIALRRRAVASYMRRLQYLRPCQYLSIETTPRYTLLGHLRILSYHGQTGSQLLLPGLSRSLRRLFAPLGILSVIEMFRQLMEEERSSGQYFATPAAPAKLTLMQRRHSYVWALGSLAILTTLLALQHHPGGFKPAGTACVSAPSAPRASFESAEEDAGLLHSFSGGCGDIPASRSLPLRVRTAHPIQQSDQSAIARSLLYGSLFRRPPPRLT